MSLFGDSPREAYRTFQTSIPAGTVSESFAMGEFRFIRILQTNQTALSGLKISMDNGPFSFIDGGLSIRLAANVGDVRTIKFQNVSGAPIVIYVAISDSYIDDSRATFGGSIGVSLTTNDVQDGGGVLSLAANGTVEITPITGQRTRTISNHSGLTLYVRGEDGVTPGTGERGGIQVPAGGFVSIDTNDSLWVHNTNASACEYGTLGTAEV